MLNLAPKRHFYYKRFYLLAAVTFLLFSCTKNPEKPRFDNPRDPSGDNYIPPEVFLLSASLKADTLATDSATIQWQGNTQDLEYSYKLNSAIWTPWSQQSSSELKHLNEGKNVFYVMSRYPGFTSASPVDSSFFFVNAIKGPALIMQPKVLQVQTNDAFQLEIYIDEVTDLLLAHIVISFDTAVVNVDSIIKEISFLSQNQGQVVFRSATTNNTIFIDAGVGMGQPSGVSGSGNIAMITFTSKVAGNPKILFDTAKCELRYTNSNTTGNPVLVNTNNTIN